MKDVGILWVQSGPLDGWAFKHGVWVCVEIKDGRKPPSRQRLTDLEQEFIDLCERIGAPVKIWRSVADVLDYAGAA